MASYKIANASEYLVITGAGIEDIKLAKKSWVLPGQKCSRFNLSPVNYSFQVQAMSSEKLPFILPAVFTIGPRSDNIDSLKKYAQLLCHHDQLSNHVKDLVQGIIEGETRVLAASMTMEEMFKGTKEFKQEVFDKVQLELNQFGLLIYNANIKQLVDVAGSEYFSFLGMKIQQGAENQARVDVAEAKKKGEIGSNLREGETAQFKSKIDAETKIYSTKRQGEAKMEEIRTRTEVKVFENVREAEVAEANAELAKKQAECTKEAQVARVEAEKAVAIRDAELQKEVEKMKALSRTEELKAKHLSEATVEVETKKQEANWEFYQKQKKADAVLYQREKEAEALKANADADFYTKKKQTDAEVYRRQLAADIEFYSKKREAEGLMALGQAQSAYLRSISDAVGGNYAAMRDYMMIDRGMFQDMARINADAVKGLQPKISIWSNGGADGSVVGGGGGVSSAMKEVAGVYKMLPPVFDSVHEHYGMKPPSWLGTLSNISPSTTNSTPDTN